MIIGAVSVHLLPSARGYLADPCLPRFFTGTYRALSMVGAFAIFLINFFSKRWIDHLPGRALERNSAMVAVAAGIYAFSLVEE